MFGWRRIAEEAAAGLFLLINIARMVRSQKMARRTRKAYQIRTEDPKEMKCLGYQGADDKITAQQILKNRSAVNLQ